MPSNFFDTNLLLYLASGNPAKAGRAEKLAGEGGTISVQVLNEGRYSPKLLNRRQSSLIVC